MYSKPRVPQVPCISHECLVWPIRHAVQTTRYAVRLTRCLVQPTCRMVQPIQPPLQLYATFTALRHPLKRYKRFAVIPYSFSNRLIVKENTLTFNPCHSFQKKLHLLFIQKSPFKFPSSM